MFTDLLLQTPVRETLELFVKPIWTLLTLEPNSSYSHLLLKE